MPDPLRRREEQGGSDKLRGEHLEVRALRRVILLAGIVLFFAASAGRSDAKLRLLPPSAFPGLPVNLAEELKHRGCQIPQIERRRRNNVINGEFLQSGQFDWAVLCTTKKHTSLLVFGNGSKNQVVEIETRRNGFSGWSIELAGVPFMTQWQAGWNKHPVPVDHPGIQSYVQYGDWNSPGLYSHSDEATVNYCDRGQWIKLGTSIGN